MSEPDVSVTFRHLQSDPKAPNRGEKRAVPRETKFSPLPVPVISSPAANIRRVAGIEFYFHGKTIHGKNPREDLYAAVDSIVGKVARRVKDDKRNPSSTEEGLRSEDHRFFEC